MLDGNGDVAVTDRAMPTEHIASNLLEAWSKATPMGTLIVELPTSDANPCHVVRYGTSPSRRRSCP